MQMSISHFRFTLFKIFPGNNHFLLLVWFADVKIVHLNSNTRWLQCEISQTRLLTRLSDSVTAKYLRNFFVLIHQQHFMENSVSMSYQKTLWHSNIITLTANLAKKNKKTETLTSISQNPRASSYFCRLSLWVGFFKFASRTCMTHSIWRLA